MRFPAPYGILECIHAERGPNAMKNIKRFGRFLLLPLLAALLCGLLASCNVANKLLDDPEMDALFEQAYTSLYNGDADAFRDMLHPSALTQSADNGEQAIADLIRFIKEPLTEYRAVSRQTSVQSNLTQKQAIYAITLEGQAYHINLAYRVDEEGAGLSAFRLDVAKEANSGFSWPSTPGQWGVFLFMVLSALFIVFTFIVCCRDRIKLKAVMILMVLLCNVGFLITFGEGKAGFQLLLFQFGTSTLQTIGSGFALRLFFPVGAVVYWFLRRPLRLPPAPAAPVDGAYYPPGMDVPVPPSAQTEQTPETTGSPEETGDADSGGDKPENP